jgi:hypothetical protein
MNCFANNGLKPKSGSPLIGAADENIGDNLAYFEELFNSFFDRNRIYFAVSQIYDENQQDKRRKV